MGSLLDLLVQLQGDAVRVKRSSRHKKLGPKHSQTPELTADEEDGIPVHEIGPIEHLPDGGMRVFGPAGTFWRDDAW